MKSRCSSGKFWPRQSMLSSSHMYFPGPIFICHRVVEEMSLIPGTLIHLHKLSLVVGDLATM